MSYKHHLGLHLPLRSDLEQLMVDAELYGVTNFQFFLAPSQRNSKNIRPSKEHIDRFIEQKNRLCNLVIIHSSYWINPATGNSYRFNIAKSLLKKEMALAKKLEIPYIVLHPGSATWHKPTDDDPYCRKGGIEQVAKMLNLLLKKERDVMILLENTAHGNRTIGSNISDLYEIKQRLDAPDRVGFCLDTAHAFSYGYDLLSPSFIKLLEDQLSFPSIKVIHFNDSYEAYGSKHDRHALPGHGLIGKNTLQALLHHTAFKNTPKIIEVTNAAPKTIQQNLIEVSDW